MDHSSATAVLTVFGILLGGFLFFCLIDFLVKSRRP